MYFIYSSRHHTSIYLFVSRARSSMAQSPRLLDLPWKVKLSISTLSFAIDITRRSNGTVNRFLMSLFDFKTSPSKKPVNGVKSTDITIDKARNLWFRLYTPTTTTGGASRNDVSMPVIFFFHGGGFAYMSPDSKLYDDFCTGLRASSLQLSSPSTTASLQNIAVQHNTKTPFFGGEERTESETRLSGQVPFVTIERADWMWRAFLPEGSDRDHPAANVFGLNSVDLSGREFPATIVFIGGLDPLQDWQRRYYEGLKKSGKKAYLVEYPNTFHAFYAYPDLPEFSLFIKEVMEFVQKQSAAANK
ncbi:hypothetical protein GH714_021772 [Hevea brasiliensis]|uniref:Alpha/beta hydrolase fold-3 domain-containing protein n=1 Tax=Hevea brasiliensis TaxID=3981 RepID=A0A6A6MP27_HEVBR|nr:hypothetical protein GH714_021772 [Hevea brasiliensis]